VLKLAHPRLWQAGAVLIAAAIVVGSLLPGPVVARVHVWDKLEHAGAYFLLTMWLEGILERRRYAVAVVVALLLGIGLEIAQGLLTATRQADFSDLIANALGILLALVLAYLGLGGWAGRVERFFGAVPPR
jgi:VanZ family protein